MRVFEYLQSLLGIDKKTETPQAEIHIIDVKEASLRAERNKFLKQYYTIGEAKEFYNHPAVQAMYEFCNNETNKWIHPEDSYGLGINFDTKSGTLQNVQSVSLGLSVAIGDVSTITKGYLYIDPEEIGFSNKGFDRSKVFAYGVNAVPRSIEISDNTLVTEAAYNELGQNWNVFNGSRLSNYKKENIYEATAALQTAVEQLRDNAEKNHDFDSLKVISKFMRTFEPFIDAVLDMRNKYNNIEPAKDVGLSGR